MDIQPITTNQPLEAPLPQEVLSKLYASMLKARLLRRRWRNAPRTGEAVLAGLLENVEPQDVLVTPVANIAIEALAGSARATKLSRKTKKSADAPADAAAKVIIAGIDAAGGVASGMALAMKRSQSNSVVVGVVPGKLARGKEWGQATGLASTYRVPVVFVVDSTELRATSKHDRSLFSRWPYPKIAVDGRDVIAVYRVTKEAISAARRGHGPTLVDCVNFRTVGERTKDVSDPLTSFRGYLERHNAWSDEWYKALEIRLKREIGRC